VLRRCLRIGRSCRQRWITSLVLCALILDQTGAASLLPRGETAGSQVPGCCCSRELRRSGQCCCAAGRPNIAAASTSTTPAGCCNTKRPASLAVAAASTAQQTVAPACHKQTANSVEFVTAVVATPETDLPTWQACGCDAETRLPGLAQENYVSASQVDLSLGHIVLATESLGNEAAASTHWMPPVPPPRMA